MEHSDVGDRLTADASGDQRHHLEILLISFAALLLEISFTRIISFKLWYYYTYLVIGLSLLGLGTGGVLVAVSDRVRRASTNLVLQWGLLLGAVSVGVSYLVVARLPIRSAAIWDYGSATFASNLMRLLVLCTALFSSFIAIGVMIATLLGRRADQAGTLYFADLLGAGLACAIVVPLMSYGGPPSVVFLAGAILALTGLRVVLCERSPFKLRVSTLGLSLLLLIGAVAPDVLPDIRVDDDKGDLSGVASTRWSPIFRVDVAPFFGRQLVFHDGQPGSVILAWDGDLDSLDEFEFERDARSFPFDVLGEAPQDVMIVGAAGGHEVLASLAYDAGHIDAVELNPATYELVTGEYAEFSGRFFDQPTVDYVTDDGRSFLARSGDSYDLIWFPAPDSYAVSNVAASSAFVLSESYLYTSEAVGEAVDHLSASGIVAAQFGELNYDLRSTRTTRYASTVRHALESMGVDDPASHVLVASTGDEGAPHIRYSTVLVKKTPFTDEEIERFAELRLRKPSTRLEHLPGATFDNDVSNVLNLPESELDGWYAQTEYDVSPVHDNSPFFWHFARFGDVIRESGDPVTFVDPEVALGERVLLLLLVIAVVLAALFLLVPFVAVRTVWSALPRKLSSATYFAMLGLGFMFFEITLIQKFILFLGYPTYSLTVTLASLLIFTGVGAFTSGRLSLRGRSVIGSLTVAVVALTAFYLFGLPRVIDAWLDWPLAGRVLVAFVALAPLGLCLGMFMPLGVGAVAALTPLRREYVAWGWAVNGFASVVGSVLTTVVAMTFGFNVVLLLGLFAYAGALIMLRSLSRPIPSSTPMVEATPTPAPLHVVR